MILLIIFILFYELYVYEIISVNINYYFKNFELMFKSIPLFAFTML